MAIRKDEVEQHQHQGRSKRIKSLSKKVAARNDEAYKRISKS